MKVDIAEQWATTLESGKYTQGTHALSVDDKYCCLGVLCEMAVEAGVIPAPEVRYGYKTYGPEDDCRRDILPRKVQEWAGMVSCNGTFPINQFDTSMCLASENDKGRTFSDIAGIIRYYADII